MGSVGDGGIGSSTAFLFFAGGGEDSSSSESSVKSMISLVSCALTGGGTPFGAAAWISFDGDSSLFTRPSSSSSESRITISASLGGGCPCPLTPLAEGFGGDGGRAACAGGWAGLISGCVAFHCAEPYLLSSECHCPSASTITSSNSSGVERKISSKYLPRLSITATIAFQV